MFASLSLPKLWSLLVNIHGWCLPVWTSFQIPHSQLLKIPACQWHLVSTPAALDWSSGLSSLASETHSCLVGPSSPHFKAPPLAPCLFPLLPPGPFQETPSLGSHLPFECFTEHVYVILQAFHDCFLLIFSHWVQMLFSLSTSSLKLFSVIYTSCHLIANTVEFGS